MTKDHRSIDSTRLGAHLARLRHPTGITQVQLAAKIGITHQQVQKYEKGSTIPTIDRLYEIASILNTSPIEILKECEIDKYSNKVKKKQGGDKSKDQWHLESVFKHFSQIEDKSIQLEAFLLMRALVSK